MTHGRGVEIVMDEMLYPCYDYNVLGDEFHNLFVCEYFRQENGQLTHSCILFMMYFRVAIKEISEI